MEITACTVHNDNCIHCVLYDGIICVSKFCNSYAEDILNDVILLQNVFKLKIPVDEICYSRILLKSYDKRIKIELTLANEYYYFNIGGGTFSSNCNKDIDEVIAYLDAKFPDLRQDNCSKMALK